MSNLPDDWKNPNWDNSDWTTYFRGNTAPLYWTQLVDEIIIDMWDSFENSHKMLLAINFERIRMDLDYPDYKEEDHS